MRTGSKQFFLFMLNIIVAKYSNAQTMADADDLYTAIMANYNAIIRPNDMQYLPTTIEITLDIYAIVETDLRNGLLSLSIGLASSWTDKRVSWNVQDYNFIKKLIMPMKKMWAPKFTFPTPVEPLTTFGTEDVSIHYYFTGEASLYITDLIKVFCHYNVKKYPFDTQVCTFKALPPGYTNREINFEVRSDPIRFDYFEENDEWEIKKVNTSIEENRLWIAVRYSITLRRRWQFFILIYNSPIMFLVLLNSMVFILPAVSGERIGYAMTVLLSLAVYLTVITDSLPGSSKNIPYISFYIISMLGCSTLFCLCTIISLVVYNKPDTKTVPNWLKQITLRLKNPPSCNCPLKATNIKITPAETKAVNIIGEDVKEVLEEDSVIYKEIDKALGQITWSDIGECLDKLFFFGSLTLTFSITIGFYSAIAF